MKKEKVLWNIFFILILITGLLSPNTSILVEGDPYFYSFTQSDTPGFESIFSLGV